MSIGSYGIVTPAKDEAGNVPKLFEAIRAQEILPRMWVIVDDGSIDDTAGQVQEQIQAWDDCDERPDVRLISHDTSDTEYALGAKYAQVVKFGLSRLLEFEASLSQPLDYFGILDCDVFPEPAYYRKLIAQFESDPKLGICSGGTLHEQTDDGKIDVAVSSRSHAPGGLRLWRAECLHDTGYEPTISQDAVSEARAIMLGWRVRSFPEAAVTTRKRGAKFGYAYYGRSAFLRGVPFWYVLLGGLRMLLNRRSKDASDYVAGYRQARATGDARINDPLARRYFRWIFFYRLIGK